MNTTAGDEVIGQPPTGVCVGSGAEFINQQGQATTAIGWELLYPAFQKPYHTYLGLIISDET